MAFFVGHLGEPFTAAAEVLFECESGAEQHHHQRGRPHTGVGGDRVSAELRARALQTKPSFVERFAELEAIGVRDVEMPGRLGMSAGSLLDMMKRYRLTPSDTLRAIAADRRRVTS